MLNRLIHVSLIDYLADNLDKLVPAALVVDPKLFFDDLGKGLAELSETTQDTDKLKELAKKALALDYREFLNICKHEVGTFLVELMRVCNQNLHDRGLLKGFRAKLEAMGMPWKGDPDECIEHVTFSDLSYRMNDGGYVHTQV
jgi:hypothetical protein